MTLDRLFLVRRQTGRFEIRLHDGPGFERMRALDGGALILSAHLGSFEALRLVANEHSIPINVVGYFRNARKINGVLQRLDPESKVRLIEVDPENPEFIFAIRDRIAAGEHVAILADRVGLGGPTAEIDFLGGTASFPLGPYFLASVVGCPVFLFFALYRDPNRYDVHCELFADRIRIPRDRRDRLGAEFAHRFADRLADHARRAPDNWFNFYDFWMPAGGRVESGRR